MILGQLRTGARSTTYAALKDVPMSETATEVGSDSGQRPSYSQRKLLRVIPEKHLPKCEEKNYFKSLRPALVRLLAEEID